MNWGRRRAGLTVIEVLTVLAIGILVGGMVVRAWEAEAQATRRAEARAQLAVAAEQLVAHRARHGLFPATLAEGAPSLPATDPWGSPWLYGVVAGGASAPAHGLVLQSAGPDRQPGGAATAPIGTPSTTSAPLWQWDSAAPKARADNLTAPGLEAP